MARITTGFIGGLPTDIYFQTLFFTAKAKEFHDSFILILFHKKYEGWFLQTMYVRSRKLLLTNICTVPVPVPVPYILI